MLLYVFVALAVLVAYLAVRRRARLAFLRRGYRAEPPCVRVNGVELHVEEHGPRSAAHTVVLSHGWMFDTHMWTHQVKSLVARGYHVVCYDHRGQGKSEVLAGGAVVPSDQSADDAIALLEHLRTTLHRERFVWVGLSMGGYAGMRVAARRPDLVEALALLDTQAANEQPKAAQAFLLWVCEMWGFVPLVRAELAKVFFAPSFAREQPREYAYWMARVVANRDYVVRSLQGLWARGDWRPQLAKITCPTLIVHGREDKAIPLREAEDMQRLLVAAGNSRVSMHVIDNCGHQSAFEQPKIVNGHLERWLADVAPLH